MFEGIKKWWNELWEQPEEHECAACNEPIVLPKPEPKFYQPTDPRLEFETGKTYEEVTGSLTVMFEDAPEPKLQQPISDAPPELIVPKVRNSDSTPVDVEPMLKAVVEELNGDIEYRKPTPYPEELSVTMAVETLSKFSRKTREPAKVVKAEVAVIPAPVEKSKPKKKAPTKKASVKTAKKTVKKKSKK